MSVALDDELISAYIDDELPADEAKAVSELLQTEPNWRERYEAFKKDAADLKRLPCQELSPEKREEYYELTASDRVAGEERRRVPRFRRRWMLVAAFFIPASLTLMFFQNPNATCRLYLKKDGLELQAGRSILEQEFGPSKTWYSPKLWGQLEIEEAFYLSFQVDAEQQPGARVGASVVYDFNGDGAVDREEVYSEVKLDARKGWERFTPPLERSKGDFAPFEGGVVKVTINVEGTPTRQVKISGTPGELILPYKALKTTLGAAE